MCFALNHIPISLIIESIALVYPSRVTDRTQRVGSAPSSRIFDYGGSDCAVTNTRAYYIKFNSTAPCCLIGNWKYL